MHLFDQISTGAFLVFAVPFLAFLVVMVVVQAIRGTDLKAFEAMRTTNPPQFAKIVWICRYNGAMAVGLGFACFVVGLNQLVMGFAPFDLQPLLEGLLGIVIGVGMTWFAFRWLRWAWRTKLDCDRTKKS